MSLPARKPAAPTGRKLFLADGTPVALRYSIGEGGEARVYRLAGRTDVAKIYSDPADADEAKLDLLISFYDSVKGDELLRPLRLPKAKLLDADRRCVGFIMDGFRGITLEESLWQDELRRRNWTRKHLVELAISIVEVFARVRSYGILVGDINLRNILVSDDRTFAVIDTDSMQIGDFPCTVHRYEFATPRYIKAKRRGELMRTNADENYAITTLLFYILMPEKSPFMSSAGLNTEQAFRQRRFVFPEGYGNVNALARGTERMWYDLPQEVRKAFCDVYTGGADITPKEWLEKLYDYRTNLEGRWLSSVIFPRTTRQRRVLSLADSPVAFDRLRATPDRDYSHKPIEDLALVVLDVDGIWGVIHNNWRYLNSLNPKLRMRQLGSELFSRIDSAGRLPLDDDEWFEAFRGKMYEWLKSLGKYSPPFTRVIAVAAPAVRAVANRDEFMERLALETNGLNVNLAFAADDDAAYVALARRLPQAQQGGPCVVMVGTGVWCRLLFVGADGSIIRALTLDNCGHRILANRFFFMSGDDRLPAVAWSEHCASCASIVDSLELPLEFTGAPMVVMGLTGPWAAASVEELESARADLLRHVTDYRDSVADYHAELADYDAAQYFYQCLVMPLVAGVAARIRASAIAGYPADMKSIVAITVARSLMNDNNTTN